MCNYPVLLFLLSTIYPDQSTAGCYYQQLCCANRNLSCTSIEDGIKHLPSEIIDDNYRELSNIDDNKRSEQLKLSPNYDNYDRFENIYSINLEKTSDKQQIYRRYQFGQPYWTNASQTDKIRYLGNHPIIRYSFIDQHIPIITDDNVKRTIKRRDTINDDRYNPTMIVIKQKPTNICYCDSDCIQLGDCCTDYRFVCRPIDCFVSDWSQWSECNGSQSKIEQLFGVRYRNRIIIRHNENGGRKCPHLIESIGCFQTNNNNATLSTTALLIDYHQYVHVRQTRVRNAIYWDLPSLIDDKLIYYCVIYRIDWINRNCVDRHARTLFIGHKSMICAECQPEAQMHHIDHRCTSDLNDNQLGFWKLIGVQSCTGIWMRTRRKDHCRCANDFAYLPSVLLV